jgi:DNA-binding response OmpR family regulator
MSQSEDQRVRVPLIVFAGRKSLPAELWSREGDHGTVWCKARLEPGLRCDVMLEGIAAGVPVLVRVEVVEVSEALEGAAGGYLHLVELAFLRRDDRRKLDVWMRAAQASKRPKAQAAEPAGPVTRPGPPPKGRSPRRRPASHVSRAVFPAGPRQVLLVEGGRSHAKELAQAMDPSGRDFVVEAIWTLAELKGRLALGRVHLVILDPNLPDSRGLITVEEAVRSARGVPVVVLSGEDTRGFEVKCLLAGAARVMRRDAMGPRLARRILALLGVSTQPQRRSRQPLPDANPDVAKPVPRRRPRRRATPPTTPLATPAHRIDELLPPAPEPVVEEPPAPEPLVEEPPAPEPVVEEPPAPEPVVEEPPAPEPAQPARRNPPALPAPVLPDPAAVEPEGTGGEDSMTAELWWHDGGYAAIWATEALRIGLRCEMLLDPEGAGSPELFRVEVVRAHHKRAPDGRNGYLHEATMVIAPSPEPAPAPAAPAAPPGGKPRRPPETAPPVEMFRVVLVENNPSFGASALRRQLGRQQALLIETRSSLAGLRARARRGDMDLVLLELDLPDSQGVATAELAVASVGGVPVVALASEPDDALREACQGLGVASLVDKSVDREALLALIEGFRA